jgi:hypothetical protein
MPNRNAVQLFLPNMLVRTIASAHADSGRIEINQASVDAAGDFPVTISAPGNYLLTGDLTVPAGIDAFVLNTSEVVIDLNGFTIHGPFLCNTSSCVAGAGSAIRPGNSLAFGRDSTVPNGTIRGFGGDCVSLFSQVRVDDLLVTECGLNGISVRDGSLVTNNRVSRTGEVGILMGGITHPPAYAHNTVANVGLRGGTFSAVSGGRATAGNSCDDASCFGSERRRYYLTQSFSAGNHGATGCTAGFHMAAVFELIDLSDLKYDTALGRTSQDSASGPPTSVGWIRNGTSFNSLLTCGSAQSGPWTSADANDEGSLMSANVGLFGAPASGIPRWETQLTSCDTTHPMWCVED